MQNKMYLKNYSIFFISVILLTNYLITTISIKQIKSFGFKNIYLKLIDLNDYCVCFNIFLNLYQLFLIPAQNTILK